jgi:exodeoxyribonuclease-3
LELERGLPGDESDVQSRYIEAVIPWGKRVLRLASLYLPNGNPVGTDKYPYKLAFMDRLIRHARDRLAFEEPFVIAGDYNVIPEPRDAAHPEAWVEDALFRPETRAKYQELLALGFTDALRATTDEGGLYTFWDYQAGAWQRNNGIRIDHLLLSPQAADRLQSVVIDKAMRAKEKASDHVPIRMTLKG